MDLDPFIEFIASNALPIAVASLAVLLAALVAGAWRLRRSIQSQREDLLALEARVKVLEGRATSPERTVRRIRELVEDPIASWQRDQQKIDRLVEASGTNP